MFSMRQHGRIEDASQAPSGEDHGGKRTGIVCDDNEPSRSSRRQELATNFIFVGANIFQTESKTSIRSLVMREHYRKKKLTTPKSNSTTIAIHPKPAKRSHKLRGKVKHSTTDPLSEADSELSKDLGLAGLESENSAFSTPNTTTTTSNAGAHEAIALLPTGHGPATSPPYELFYDPILQLTASLDPESRRHVRRCTFSKPSPYLSY
ncbi:hypothetical protein K461DRAFT_152652 [Myriangium duriaei CBS 260.36]|uniref:Uncharacterized protein n=1 Tax=Myriangium duriaei CBS 260.36 TaxID=1168546 RepID=A0A9P4MH17_9PEZI|nr:hypothetical protein K461DRAFT_152652 [Myriangium duriaei CBS 260.36]